MRSHHGQGNDGGQCKASPMIRIPPASLPRPEHRHGHGHHSDVIFSEPPDAETDPQPQPPASLPRYECSPGESSACHRERDQHHFVVVVVETTVVVSDAQGREQRHRGMHATAKGREKPPEEAHCDQHEGRAEHIGDSSRQTHQLHGKPKHPRGQRRMLVVAPLKAAHPGELLDVVRGRHETRLRKMRQPDGGKQGKQRDDPGSARPARRGTARLR